MKKLILFSLSALLLSSCGDSTQEPKNIDTIASDIPVETEKTAIDFTDRLSFIFEENGILNKFDSKLNLEDIRGLLNQEHEEGNDTLIYSREFGLTEAVDIEYYFNKRSRLNEINIISYHENAASQMSFDTAVSRFLDSKAIYVENDKWEAKKLGVVIEMKLTGNKKNKNVELKVSKL